MEKLVIMALRTITSEQIRQFTQYEWTGPVEILVTKSQMIETTRKIMKEKVLGFDVEYQTGNSGPALVQLATESCVYLYRMDSACKYLKTLRPILESKKVTKVGIGLGNDLKSLHKFCDFTENGFSDVAILAHHRGYLQGGLRSLAAMLLGIRVSKNLPKTQHWMQSNLSPKQVRYAATDADVSRQLYLMFKPGQQTYHTTSPSSVEKRDNGQHNTKDLRCTHT